MARDWWQKGRGFDLWSIPHLLFGILMGMVPLLAGISFLTAFTLTLILAVLWEVYEKFSGIKETVQNILFDLILSVMAFIITSLALLMYPLHTDDLRVVASAVFIVYAFTNISGWLAYRRRDHNFMH